MPFTTGGCFDMHILNGEKSIELNTWRALLLSSIPSRLQENIRSYTYLHTSQIYTTQKRVHVWVKATVYIQTNVLFDLLHLLSCMSLHTGSYLSSPSACVWEGWMERGWWWKLHKPLRSEDVNVSASECILLLCGDISAELSAVSKIFFT